MNNSQDYLILVAPLAIEDGGGFMARVPDLPGCFGDGETPEEALKDALKAITEWTDEYEKMGRAVPSPGSMEAEIRAHREAEIKLISELRNRLREKEKDFESLDSRLDAIERDVLHLLDTFENEEAWERFEIITKTTRSQQKDLFC